MKRKLGPTYDVVSFDCNGDQTNEVLLVGFDDDYYTNYGTKLARFDFSNSNEGINILETYTGSGYPYDCPHSKWSNIFPGDFNGDGKTDLLYSNCDQWDGYWHIWFSNGNTMNRPLFVDNNDNSYYDHQGLPNLDTYTNLFPPSLSQMGIVYDNHNLMFSVADFDGDGCTDVCFSYGSNRYLFIASKIKADLDGQSVTFRKRQKLDILFNFKSQYTHVGNFLGRDNFSMLESISNNAYIIAPASVNRYNSVESITDGLGNTTSFTYDYLMPKNENNDDNFYSFNYHIEDQYGVRPIPVPTLALKTYKVEGINGSSVISKYSYSQARFHKKGHGFIGFKSATTETYKNSLTLPWKSRKTTWYNGEVLSSHGMLLPVREESYINCDGTAHLIGETIYEFDKVILSSNNTNLVVCPALKTLKESTYSMDDGHDLIKTVVTNYEYDYNNNNTFEFVVSAHDEQPVKELKMKFMKGNYEISNVRCFTMDVTQTRKVDEFRFDKQKTKGDDIVGSIDVTEDGYFKLTVPYADGFTAYVDGEKTDVECVDTAFIGFPLKKGSHDIKITFTAPLLKEGIIMSAAGVLILAVLIFFEQRKCRKSKDVKE